MRTQTRSQFLREVLHSSRVPFQFLNGKGYAGVTEVPALVVGGFSSQEPGEVTCCTLQKDMRRKSSTCEHLAGVIMCANFIHEILTWKAMPPNFYDLGISYVLSYAPD